MKVLYLNNCWFTNVGEAFIDIGAMKLIKNVFNNPQIINFSSMNNWYISDILKDEKYQYLDMSRYYSGEYVVLAGMFGSEDFLNNSVSLKKIKGLVEKGAKLIFLGFGQCTYKESETKKIIEFFKEIKPVLMVSRDNVVYNNFKDIVPSINGLDCAFWVSEVYDPRTTPDEEYDVVTFNRSPYPEIVNSTRQILTAYHFQYYLTRNKIKDNMLISDTPYDYITLYANAKKVWTDLLHASIISLQYERPVKFQRVDKRGYAIDTLNDIAEFDEEGYMYIKSDLLADKKKAIEIEIRNIIN